MKSDRFKKPATLSRYARRLGGEAMVLANEAGPPYLDLSAAPAQFDLKALIRGNGLDGDWQALFSDMLHELQDSPLAAALVRRAVRKGWALGIAVNDSRREDYFYCLDIGAKTVWLDHGGFSAQGIRRTPHCREALTGSLVRALRDIGHEARLGPYQQAMRPDAVMLMERARSADIETVCVLAAWEMRSAGHAGLWRHLLGSEDGDLALTFGYMIEKNPKSLYDGKALAETFLRWYADPMRINGCDHDALEMLDHLVDARDPEDGWGKLSFSTEDARDLSILPDGLAYLKDEAKMLVCAAEYHQIPDAINEAHLHQIVHDLSACRVAGVPFRTASLARRIFPANL